MLGKWRQTELSKKFIKSHHNDQQKWNEIITSLDEELRVKEQLLLLTKSKATTDKDDKNSVFTVNSLTHNGVACSICGNTDHKPTVIKNGKVIVNYFACRVFAASDCRQRLETLKRLELCHQCLFPGAKHDHTGPCSVKFICPHNSHNNQPKIPHVLVCKDHMNETANKKLVDDYRSQLITRGTYDDFSHNIGIFYNTSFPASYHVDDDETSNPDEPECARFLTQRISIDGQDVNIFFDSGCGDMTCRKSLVHYLTRKCMAKNITPGPG